MNIEATIKKYQDACNDVVRLFADKYDVCVSQSDWVAGEIGGTICVNDEFYLPMDEIILMLTRNVEWSEFLRYWDYNMDAYYLGINTIKMKAWIDGAPRLNNEQIENLKERKAELDGLIKSYNEKF